ncbi:AAA family ATPase [Nocardioides aquaticus]|uniref:AAA family ATPase n=1 Tax=Nocardioides aquaticus TaxID=160826 RepID=UPI001BD5E0E3|nr:DUF3696 domain-containing protein [Nocardioides aquaticus]
MREAAPSTLRVDDVVASWHRLLVLRPRCLVPTSLPAMGLIDTLHRLLGNDARLTARELVRMARAEDLALDKTAVNYVLYQNELFRHDGAVPPRWSLASTPMEARVRTPHRVQTVAVRNWKVFEETEVPLAGITLVYGENSTGKSSIFQALLLMKRSWGYGYLRFEAGDPSFGWYEHVVHRHDLERDIRLTAEWGERDSDRYWSVTFVVPAGPPEHVFNPDHDIARILCEAPGIVVGLQRIDPTTSPGMCDWAVARFAPDEPNATSLPVHDPLLLTSSGPEGFPDLAEGNVAVASGSGGLTGPQNETLSMARQVLAGAAEMFDTVEHIGPTRAVPQRDILVSVARENAPYLIRLFDDDDLVTDVNEWLLRFEIPYKIEVDCYGDYDGDDSFEVVLRHRSEGGERVQLRDVGFGVSQILPIIVQLLGSSEKTILIEEPEAHLHPRLQSVLGDLFITSTEDYGNVLVVETHSEPILLRLQRRIAEGRIRHDDVAVAHVVRHGRSSEVEEVRIGANGQLDYEWPGGFFDDRMDDLVAILDPRPEA